MGQVYYDNSGTENLQRAVQLGLGAFTDVNGALQRQQAMAIQQSLAEQEMAQRQQQFQQQQARLAADQAAQQTYNQARLEQGKTQFEAANARTYDLAQKSQQTQLQVAGMRNAGALSPDGTARWAWEQKQRYLSGDLARSQKALDIAKDPFKGSPNDVPGLEKRVAQARSLLDQHMASMPQPGQGQMGQPMAPQGKTLDATTARSFLQQAGGDKNAARQMATQQGYTIPQDAPAAPQQQFAPPNVLLQPASPTPPPVAPAGPPAPIPSSSGEDFSASAGPDPKLYLQAMEEGLRDPTPQEYESATTQAQFTSQQQGVPFEPVLEQVLRGMGLNPYAKPPGKPQYPDMNIMGAIKSGAQSIYEAPGNAMQSLQRFENR